MTGEQLKKVLVNRKINFSALARKIGLTPQALNERFKNDDPKYSFVEKIAEAAGLTLYALKQETQAFVDESDETYGGQPIVDYREKYFACVEEKASLLTRMVSLQDQIMAGQGTVPDGHGVLEKHA